MAGATAGRRPLTEVARMGDQRLRTVADRLVARCLRTEVARTDGRCRRMVVVILAPQRRLMVADSGVGRLLTAAGRTVDSVAAMHLLTVAADRPVGSVVVDTLEGSAVVATSAEEAAGTAVVALMADIARVEPIEEKRRPCGRRFFLSRAFSFDGQNSRRQMQIPRLENHSQANDFFAQDDKRCPRESLRGILLHHIL